MKSKMFLLTVFVAAAVFYAGNAEITKKKTNQGTVTDRTRLFRDLFTDYNKKINADNVTVKFGIALINYDILEDKQAVDASVWLRYLWKDTRLAWDPKEYNVDILRIDPEVLWIPDVTLYSSADPVNMMSCWSSNALIYPSGDILWVPPCKILSRCNLTLKKHPYGEQTCSLKFGSWTFDGNCLDLQLYEQDPTRPFDLSDLQNNKTSSYQILKATAERNEKYYPCCEGEPYPDLTFNLTLHRVSSNELFSRF